MAEQRGPGQDVNHFPEVVETGRVNPLTGIPPAYTLAATQEGYANDADGIMVRHFLNILAEIAMLVASKKVSE